MKATTISYHKWIEDLVTQLWTENDFYGYTPWIDIQNFWISNRYFENPISFEIPTKIMSKMNLI